MKKTYKVTIAMLIVISLIIVYFTYPVFYLVDYDTYNELCQNLEEPSDGKTWIKLKYIVTTGVGWYIDKSSDTSIDGYAIIENYADLRFLEINNCFLLDSAGYVILSTEDIKHVTYKGEDIIKINPDKIYIYIDSPDSDVENEYYTMSDMNWIGMIKAFLGIFIPSCRYSV